MLRELLLDIIKHTIPLGFEIVKLVSDENKLLIYAKNPDTTKLLYAKAPAIDEFTGEIGLHDLATLKGLLELPSYSNENASLRVNMRKIEDKHFGDYIEFSDSKKMAKSFYRCLNYRIIPEYRDIASLAFDVIVQPEKTKISEMATASNVFKSSDGYCGLNTVNGNLIVSFGEEHSSVHSGKIILVENVEGNLQEEFLFNVDDLLRLLKISSKDNPPELKISNRGVLEVVINTDFASYSYYLRCKKR